MLRRTLFTLYSCITALLLSINVQAGPIKTDFVFIIDATGSMAGEIAGVRSGFSSFVAGLSAASVDARFAVVVFGGAAELTLDFTSSGAAAQTALNNITIGANAGIQNNHNVNPEAGLEAIRMVLGAAPNSTLVNNNIPEDGILNFRSDARINLILVTDEDSDTPFYSINRFGVGCNGCSPPNSFGLGGWQDEVDATAQAIINNQAFINMLINIGDPPTKQQYGDYDKDVSDPDFLNFNSAATLAALLLDSVTANSLQAQVLSAGLIARSFNVAGANDSNFIANFFAAKLEEVVTDPGVSVPEPVTFTLLLLGLIGLGFNRRKKLQ